MSYFPIILLLLRLAPIDHVAVSDQELIPKELPAIQQEENARSFIETAYTTYVKPEKGSTNDMITYLEGGNNPSVNEESIANFINQNKTSFLELENAAKAKYYQANNPVKIEDLDYALTMPISDQGAATDLMRALKIKALSELKNGNSQESIKNSLSLITLGNKRQASSLSILDYLIGSTYSTFGFETLSNTLATATLSNEELNSITEALNTLNEPTESFINTLKFEYYTAKNTVDMVKKDGSKTNYYFKPNLTKNTLKDYFTDYINLAQHNICLNEEVPIKMPNQSPLIYYSTVQNSIGNAILASLLPSKNTTNLCKDLFMRDGFKLILALKKYKNDHKEYPQNLELLIPDYIQEIPLDPYDKSPLRYNIEKKAIYSIGKDKTDHKGLDVKGINTAKTMNDTDEPTIIFEPITTKVKRSNS